MSMLRALLVISLLLISAPVWASGYQFISAEDLQKKLSAGEDVTLLDIQFEEAYRFQHLKGAVPTYAYPVKTDQSRKQLAQKVPELKQTSAPIVIVSTRGGSGAMRAFDLLQEQGIDAKRLYILQNGQQRWPYPDLLATE